MVHLLLNYAFPISVTHYFPPRNWGLKKIFAWPLFHYFSFHKISLNENLVFFHRLLPFVISWTWIACVAQFRASVALLIINIAYKVWRIFLQWHKLNTRFLSGSEIQVVNTQQRDISLPFFLKEGNWLVNKRQDDTGSENNSQWSINKRNERDWIVCEKDGEKLLQGCRVAMSIQSAKVLVASMLVTEEYDCKSFQLHCYLKRTGCVIF